MDKFQVLIVYYDDNISLLIVQNTQKFYNMSKQQQYNSNKNPHLSKIYWKFRQLDQCWFYLWKLNYKTSWRFVRLFPLY